MLYRRSTVSTLAILVLFAMSVFVVSSFNGQDIVHAAPAAEGDFDTKGPKVEHDTVLLDIPLVWPQAGAWLENGDLLVADSGRRKLLRIWRTGLVESLDRDDSDLGQLARVIGNPAHIRPIDSGFVVEDHEASELVQLSSDSTCSPGGGFLCRIGTTAASEGCQVSAIYDWLPVGARIDHDGFFSLAWCKDRNAAIYLTVNQPPGSDGKPGSTQVTVAYPGVGADNSAISRAAKDWLLRIDRFIARINDHVYFLVPKKYPSGGGRLKVALFSSDLANPGRPAQELRSLDDPVPAFKYHNDPPGQVFRISLEAAYQFQRVEFSQGVYGLYSSQDALFELRKSALGQSGRTRWELCKLVDAGGNLASVDHQKSCVVLPTSAAHLVVIPGDEEWALIERGPVVPLPDGTPTMATDSIVFFPTTELP